MKFIAHRFGNDALTLRDAERVTDLIELDVHLGLGGRVEARHAKKLWFTRRLWEKWYLLPAGTVVPSLSSILDAASAETTIWLDLKGFTPRLSHRVLREVGDRRPLIVSTKPWWLLAPFSSEPEIRTIRSAGNRFELVLLLFLPSRLRAQGSVVHVRLLSEWVMRRLRERGEVYTWAVEDRATIDRLRRAGVSGVIVDDLDLIP